LKEALTGADFVIISILPGTFDEMASDLEEPQKYGIYQSVGDTVGPGGILRALRTVPMYMEIAEAIKEFCPEAFVINYTNPMTMCVRTLYKVFPQIKAFGCCHEVFGAQELLSNALSEFTGMEKVDRKEIKVSVSGINHFTWINSARYQNIDLMEIYDKFVEKHYESGYWEKEQDLWLSNTFVSHERVKFDLYKRYGVMAAAGDRHLAEFAPRYWYLKDLETIKEWHFSITTAQWRKQSLKEKLEETQKYVRNEKELTITPTGEEGVRQIKALVGLGDLVTNVNLPNKNQIKELPLDAVVETNAVFRNNQIIPISAPKLPDSVLGLIARHVYNQETVVDAAVNARPYDAFKAFCNDPQVTLSLSDAKTLFDKMIDNTKKYIKFN